MKRILLWFLILLLAASPLVAWATGDLRPDARGDDVARLQTRLIEVGLLAAPADGIYGKATQQAVLAFQRYLQKKGYTVAEDGVASDEVLRLLADTQLTEGLSELSLGSTGANVETLQKRLYALGFLHDVPDGVFGQNTELALKAFQAFMLERKEAGIEVNGVTDKPTRALLAQDLKGYGIQAPLFYDEIDPSKLTPPYLYAQAAILLDAKTGEVLFEKNADDRMYPASTTKIMTALLAIESGKPARDVTIPTSAADIPADSSTVPVYPGEIMTLRDLVYGLMIRSGNDAANAIAQLTYGDVSSFVSAMNRKAQSLGMKDTKFANPHGYHDPEHYTTARDLGTLACSALKKKGFRDIVSKRRYTLAATKKRNALVLENRYAILDPDTPYYYPGAFGIKTGYTNAAGYCYVGAAEKGGRTLVCVLLKSGLDSNSRWLDAARLYDYAFGV